MTTIYLITLRRQARNMQVCSGCP